MTEDNPEGRVNLMKSGAKRNALAAAALVVAAAWAVADGLNRPFWYDEALTIMEFLSLGSVAKIYQNYQIPNNHISYTWLLLFWSDLWLKIMPYSELVFRALSALVGALCALAMWSCWRRRLLAWPAFLLSLAFAVSIPFQIYSTAVRGYALSALLAAVSLELHARLTRRARPVPTLLYLATAFLMVGVMPSNLAFFAALALTAFPRKPGLRTLARWAAISALPLLAFAVFYLPLLPMLASSAKATGGWASGTAAAWHFYAAFAVMTAPLLIPAAFGVFSTPLARLLTWRAALTALAFVLPALLFLSRTPSPFPRSLWAFWILWLFLLGWPLLRAAALARRRWGRGKARLLAAACAVLVVVCGAVGKVNVRALSEATTAPGEQDDFAAPYYTTDFHPRELAESIVELRKAAPRGVELFVSPVADPPSLLIYSLLAGLPDTAVKFDKPKIMITELGGGEEDLYVVARDDTDMASLKTRFHLGVATLTGDFGAQKLYSVSKEKK